MYDELLDTLDRAEALALDAACIDIAFKIQCIADEIRDMQELEESEDE